MSANRPKHLRTPEENVGIRQMTVLLDAGYPLSAKLQLAIGELVSAAARAARRTRPERLKGDKKE